MSDNAYMNTIEKLEPEIAMIDAGAFYASAAISLKRIADALDHANALHSVTVVNACGGMSERHILLMTHAKLTSFLDKTNKDGGYGF